jgi:hypothetical protein
MSKQPFFSQNIPTINNVAKPEREGIFHRILQVWLRFSGPDPARFNKSIEDQELLRRSRLLSALFSLIIVVVIVAAPTAIPDPTYWKPIICFVVVSLIALILNRSGRVTLSSIFYILAIDLTLTILMTTLPTGIRNSNIPDFDFFILPILIGGVVLPRRILLWFLAAFHICLIIALFSLLPHDPLLTKEITVNQGGFAYSELSDAFIIQIVGTTIAYLAAGSVDRALLRASRAEELAEARRHINEQAGLIVEQKRRLDYGIAVLKDAHARFANGDYRARAKLQDNELVSLAISFNLMVERLNRITQVAQEYSRLEQALQQLFDLQNAILSGASLKPLPRSNTLADHIYPIFHRCYQLGQIITRSNAALDRIHNGAIQQSNAASQLTSVLSQARIAMQLLPDNAKASLSSSFKLIEKAQQLCEQIDEQGKQCLQETRQLDQLLKISKV